MIQLIINPETHPRAIFFSQACVTIGSDSQASDLNIPEEELKPTHIKIYEEKGQFFIMNMANDPFASLNRRPFGKKKLASKDILQIGKTKIQIDLTPTISEDSDDQEAFALPVLETTEETSPHNAVRNPDQEDDEDSYDNELENNDDASDAKNPSRFGLSRKLVYFLICFMVLLLVGSGIAYRTMKNQGDRDRLIAAEGIADVAMAIAYAQVNHIKPQKQNWIDPEFLKNNLTSILSSEYPSLSYIDNQGQFCNCPYLLRIYTNSDLSQFLVMAQPNPSLLQWLVSSATIVVDSQHMELRSLYDLKSLNRLLVNANTIDRANASEIFHTVEEGELISLSSLGTAKGFTPPKALALVRPGSENRIYNAPRYYHFGEPLLTKAVELFKVMNNNNHHELVRLQQQISELSRFANLVLYSSQGIQKAIQAQKALNALSPKHAFLLAYLNFKSNGIIVNSHLLFDFEHLTTEASSTNASTAHDTQKTAMIEEVITHSHNSHSEHSPYQTLALQLNLLVSERKKELQSISNQIITTLREHEEGKLNNFNHQLQLQITQYELVDARSYQKIIEQLKELYEEHAEIPFEELTHQIKIAGLEHIAEESLRELAEASVEAIQINPIDVLQHIDNIANIQSFIQLEHTVSEIAGLLTLSHLPSADMIIHYQNEMRSKALKQLRILLLSPQSSMKAADLNEENRIALANTLKLIWVNDPDEYHYYLNEFDLLKDTL